MSQEALQGPAPVHPTHSPPDATAKATAAAQQQAQYSAEELKAEDLRAMAVCEELLVEEQEDTSAKQAKALKKKAKKQQQKAKKQLSGCSNMHTDQNRSQHSTDLQEQDQVDAYPAPSIDQDTGLGGCTLSQQDALSIAAASAEGVQDKSGNTALLGHLCCPLTKVGLYV